MNAVLSVLLGLSLSGTLMALVVMLLRRTLGSRLPSAFYYYAWLLVLLRFVLPFPGLLPTFMDREAAPTPALVLPLDAPEAETFARPYSADFYHASRGVEVHTPAYPVTASTDSEETTALDTPREPTASIAQRLAGLGRVLHSVRFWFSFWILGMLFAFVWYLSGYLHFRHELRRTLRRPAPSDLAVYDSVTDEPRPRLFRSRAVSTPMLLGVFRPMIVLPDRSYSDSMLQGVLAHEMTHCKRRDVLFKWFSVLVSIVHWFNPITHLFRYELDRSCELACDEKLLRHMNTEEKQLYGDMLIAMAAKRRLPRSVVATSFAVEKRNLKERLTQIMTYKARGRASLALILAAVLLLSACGAVSGPGAVKSVVPPVSAAVQTEIPPTPQPAEEGEEPAGGYLEVTVSTVDEFLNAIAPRTIIYLEPGVYDLSQAATYGQDMDFYYTWLEAYDGYELVIRHVDNLIITGLPGENGEEIVIAAVPRYAEVMRFENCRNLTLSAFTAGHTQEPGQCAGGVLDFDSCVNTNIVGCHLYGCGVLGVQAENCEKLYVRNSNIYECSSGAVWARSSRDLRFIECSFHDCGTKDPGFAYAMFSVSTSTGFAVVDSVVENNTASYLLDDTSSDEVYLLGTRVSGNSFSVLFNTNLIAPKVDGCSFDGNTVSHCFEQPGYASSLPLDYVQALDGTRLGESELMAMTLSHVEFDGPVIPEPVTVTGIPVQGGTEYHVSTVDEFLAAIGSDTTIYLEGELFDFSTASNYGGYGSDHYYWIDVYDGPGLVITNVNNLRIIGLGKNETTVQAVPRYADVLCFENCRNVTVAQLTAGHLREAPGSCSGDVIAFEGCRDFYVIDCGLFGCGVYGVRVNNSITGSIVRTEIYECSGGAATIFRTDGVVFTDCSVHDCVSVWQTPEDVNEILMSDSGDCSYNGVPLLNGLNEVGDNAAEAAQGNEIGIYFYERLIPNEFTIRMGEEPIVLNARANSDDPAVGESFTWAVSDRSALRLTPGPNGQTCTLEILKAVPGGVTLTVQSGGAGCSLTVYLVN